MFRAPEIALRKNTVPGRWQYRQNGDEQVYDTAATYTDFSSTAGFLQRPGHQADIWYVGIFLLPVAVRSSGWSQWYSNSTNWPTGADVNGTVDWTGRTWDAAESVSHDWLRQVAGTGKPLEAGTYYVGIYNPSTTGEQLHLVQSRHRHRSGLSGG